MSEYISLIAIAAGLSGAMWAAKKYIPKMIGRYTDKWLDKALDVEDPRDLEFVKAIIRWVEYKVPDAGSGREKYALAAKKIVQFAPIMAKYEDKIFILIENSVMALDKELKEHGS